MDLDEISAGPEDAMDALESPRDGKITAQYEQVRLIVVAIQVKRVHTAHIVLNRRTQLAMEWS